MLIELDYSPYSGRQIRVEKDRHSADFPDITLIYYSPTLGYGATVRTRFQVRNFTRLRDLVIHAESANPELTSEILGLIDRAQDLYGVALGITPPVTYQEEK